MKELSSRLIWLLAAVAVAAVLYMQVDVMHRGGPVMIPIVLCSIFSFAIIFERGIQIYRNKIDTGKFMTEVMSAIKRNRMADALELCEQTQGPVAHIVKAGIACENCSREQLRQVIEDAGVHQVPRLEKHLSALATIAHVSPLLGLLGTVTGMVQTFQAIQQKSQMMSPVDPSVLAQGIWEALITTVAGLLVAIPSFVAYNYLVTKVQDIVVDMEIIATELVNVLTQNH